MANYICGTLFFIAPFVLFFIFSHNASLKYCWLLIPAFLFGIVFASLYSSWYGDLLASLFYWSKLTKAIRNRVSPIVDPSDLKAHFIQLVLKANNWGKLMLENASENGFLKCDETSKCILFEGERTRWTIPIERVAKLKLEEVPAARDTDIEESTLILMLQFEIEGGMRTFPIAPRHCDSKPNTTRRRYNAAKKLLDELNDFIG